MSANTLKSEGEAVRAAAANVERLAAILEQSAAMVTTEDSDSIQQARARLESTHASVALGEARDEDLADARKALAEAEATHDQLQRKRSEDQALVAGLQRRLALGQQALAGAEAALQAAQIAWVTSELEKADIAYTEHGLAVAAAMVRVEALRHWLRFRGNQTMAFAPGNVELVVRPLSAISFRAACAANPDCAENQGEVWQRNVFPRLDSTSAVAALALEMSDAIATQAPTVAETGLLAGARRIARKLSA